MRSLSGVGVRRRILQESPATSGRALSSPSCRAARLAPPRRAVAPLVRNPLDRLTGQFLLYTGAGSPARDIGVQTRRNASSLTAAAESKGFFETARILRPIRRAVFQPPSSRCPSVGTRANAHLRAAARRYVDVSALRRAP